MAAFSHTPVLLEECMQGLNLKDSGIYFDGTLGGAGHSREILKRAKGSRLVATDLDLDAIEAARQNLSEFEGRFRIFHSNFKDFEDVLDEAGVEKLDGAILDLGISSYQIDNDSRGFSYMAGDAPLDMRMNREQELTAADILNTESVQRLTQIFREYGEERFAGQIAAEVARRRDAQPFRYAKDLTKVVTDVIPYKFQQSGPPQRKVFQALRIAVNQELEGLYECILGLARRLNPEGRLVIISFHSLEDRIVKTAYNYLAADCVCPKNIPVCVCGKRSEIRIVNNKPITANPREVALNPRASSAKLRVAERI
ncbi:MAG: 16S rRNA (cytosine(1402)-N(4))-methyltransferase RsmH [Clostridia bacterium]|nr:16S rRNA (cytosine(1402)-N(4))-methyltransferase RsmH [Clostridia bacterium]